MKVQIKSQKNAKKEVEMNIYLESRGNDTVVIKAEDHLGKTWTLAIISDKGIFLAGSLPDYFPIDKNWSMLKILNNI